MRRARFVFAIPASAAVVFALSPGCGVVVGVPNHTEAQNTDPSSLDCQKGFGDCNGDIDDGCETDLATDAHCGDCGVACGFGSCVDGACVCNENHADCDGDPSNACETSLEDDPKNCGTCGIDCSPGGCISGRCQAAQLVSFDSYHSQLDFFIKAGAVIYGGDGGIYSAPIDAPQPVGETAPFFATDANAVLTFLIDGDRLTWVSWDAFSSGPGTLYTTLMSGDAPPVMLATLPAELVWGEVAGAATNGLVTDATSAYWVKQTFSGGTAELHRAPFDGAGDQPLTTQTIVDQASYAWAAFDQGEVFWLGPDGVFAYDTSTMTSVEKAALNPEQPMIVANGRICGGAASFGIDDVIQCGAESGDAFSKVASFGATFVAALAVDGDDVFVSDGNTQRIFGSESGGAPLKLGVSEGPVFKILVADGDLYWSTAVGVYRLRHPFGK